MQAPSRRSTPTATCGRTPTTARVKRWTRCWLRVLRTNRVQPRAPDRISAGHSVVAEGLVCRPGSVPGRLAAFRSATIHLGPPLPAASCGPPAHSGGQPSDVRCSTLLRAGFAEPTRSPGPLVVSCTTVSPLPQAMLQAVCSLWHFPAGCPGWVLPTALPCGARTFLDATSTPRSPDQPLRAAIVGPGTVVPTSATDAERRADPVRWVDPASR